MSSPKTSAARAESGERQPAADTADAAQPAKPRVEARMAYLQNTAGNAAVARLVQEGASGARIWLDASTPRQHNASAVTMGRDVLIDPAHYRPGTMAGDALIAHEVAHTVQQSTSVGASGSTAELEADADRAAVAAVTGTRNGFFPQLRAALSLQRCDGCSPQELTLAQQLQNEREPVHIEPVLRGATEDQLERASRAVSGSSVHAEAIAWERAVRANNFSRLLELHRRTRPGFRDAYAGRILEAIMAGRTPLRIEGGADRDFVETTRGDLDRLLRVQSGFRVIVELLATGRPVRLRPAEAGRESETQADDPAAARRRLHPGEPSDPVGTGSTITIDRRPSVTLGRGAAGAPEILEQDRTVTVGHELIHALHNARGDSITTALPAAMLRRTFGGAGLVREPETNEPQSPEELRTISGARTFQQVGYGGPDTPVSFAVDAGISENDLRRDLELPERIAHFGALSYIRLPRNGARSVDALLPRYRLPRGVVPPAGAAAIRQLLVARGFDAYLQLPEPPEQLPLPHPEHVRMHIRFVLRDAVLADTLEGLTVH